MCKTISKEKLYLTHMIKVINFISNKWPSLRVLLWDDMFREFSLCDLEELAASADCVIPVVWSYVDDLTNVFPKGMLEKFGEVFEEIWIASSFKGSAGILSFCESLYTPPPPGRGNDNKSNNTK